MEPVHNKGRLDYTHTLAVTMSYYSVGAASRDRNVILVHENVLAGIRLGALERVDVRAVRLRVERLQANLLLGLRVFADHRLRAILRLESDKAHDRGRRAAGEEEALEEVSALRSHYYLRGVTQQAQNKSPREGG